MTSGASPAFTQFSAALADRYRIERELGRGGMATVYLAHDLKHDRTVAIKSSTQSSAPFSAPSNPNLLPLFDSGEANGLLYRVMPFVEGERFAHGWIARSSYRLRSMRDGAFALLGPRWLERHTSSRGGRSTLQLALRTVPDAPFRPQRDSVIAERASLMARARR